MLVIHIITFKNYSARQACALFKLNRGTFKYQAIKSDDSEIIELVKRIAESKPRWGFGKIVQWLKHQGYTWNHKRIRRIYCELKLNHRIKPKKRLPNREPKPLVVPDQQNRTWSMDFMTDSLESGKKFRTLNIIDDYNREILAVEIDYSLPAERVIRVLNRVAEERGLPEEIRVDNGPEFISIKLELWAESHQIRLENIKPGKPAQNAYIERFNRTYREDVLDMYLFQSLNDVRDITTEWMYEYNNERPHSSLGGIPPRELLTHPFNISLLLTGT